MGEGLELATRSVLYIVLKVEQDKFLTSSKHVNTHSRVLFGADMFYPARYDPHLRVLKTSSVRQGDKSFSVFKVKAKAERRELWFSDS